MVVPKKLGKQTNRGNSHPSAAVTVYRGPIIDPLDRQETDTIETVLTFTDVLDSNGAGAILDVIGNDPAASGDFASFSNIYDEYRILGERLEFFPYNRYSKTTTTCVPIIVVKDRNDSLALASYSSALQYSSAVKRSLEDPWVEQMKMVGIEDAGFVTTAATSANRWFKFYGDGLTTSTNYGRYFFYIRVQFRGRK